MTKPGNAMSSSYGIANFAHLKWKRLLIVLFLRRLRMKCLLKINFFRDTGNSFTGSYARNDWHFSCNYVPGLKKSAYAKKRGKVVVVSLSLENFGNFWSFLEPNENHCSSPSSRIRGFKTRKFSEENWKKVLDVEWICVALGVDSCTGACKPHAWKTQCACASSLLPAHICHWNYTR